VTEPLVLLMGKFCDARLFEAQISEFSRTRMVIVAPIFYGDQNPITPMRRQDVMAAMIPYSKLHVIENTGHYPTLESPEATNAAIADWLAQPYVLRS